MNIILAAKPEAAEWKNKPFRHYNEMVEMFGYVRATGESAVNASEMRHLLATEIDESASNDAPVSSTKSQSRAKKAKTDDEQTSKLDDSIGILARAFKEMVDNEKLPIPMEELWGIINAMVLEEDLAAEAFVFLLKSPVQVKGLMSTPIGLRKLVLDKMMKAAK